MSAGLRVLAYHPRRFGTFLKPSPWLPRGVRMASWLPHCFCIASAWLPNDPDDSRQLPDQLHVGSSLAFGTVRVLSRRFPKHSRSCPQRGSLRDCLGKMRKHWRQAGCPADVRRTMQTACRRCPEVHFRIQFLLWTKISMRKIRSLPKAPKRAEAFRGDKDSERNLSGICGQVAESCGFINFAFRILSRPCPGPSGRLVLGGKPAWGVHRTWRRDLALCKQNGEPRLPDTLQRKNIPMRTYMLGVNHQKGA